MPVEQDYGGYFDPCPRLLDKQGSGPLPVASLAHPPDIQDVRTPADLQRGAAAQIG